MKKYLSVAAILAAVAFLSVSTLAQAQQPAAAPAAPAAAAPAAPAAAPTAADTYAKDKADCIALASAPSTEGAAPSGEDKEASIRNCLHSKGHSDEEMKEQTDAKKGPPSGAMAPAAPAAPAAQ